MKLAIVHTSKLKGKADAAMESFEETTRRACENDNSTKMEKGSAIDKAEDAARGTGASTTMAGQEAKGDAQDISDFTKSDLHDAAKSLREESKDKVTSK